jgi:hypothetical protein
LQYNSLLFIRLTNHLVAVPGAEPDTRLHLVPYSLRYPRS